MNDPSHLREADKGRISNEAKVRTALEDPAFAQREFEKWQASKERGFEIEKRDYFVNAWAKVAWLAEGRMLAMGRELAKAQQRIGRQRKANRQAVERIKQLEALLREAQPLITHNYEGSQGLIGDAERVVGLIDASLSSEAPQKEGEDVGNRPN